MDFFNQHQVAFILVLWVAICIWGFRHQDREPKVIARLKKAELREQARKQNTSTELQQVE